MNVELSPELAEFVEEKVREGGYESPQDVVSGALELLREQERIGAAEIAELRSAIQPALDALDRGEGRAWDVAEMKRRVRATLAGRP